VTVLVCLKGIQDSENFPSQLDRYIDQYLNGGQRDILYTPSDLLSGTTATSLRGAALLKGWPSLDMLAGKFIIVMTGEGLEGYTNDVRSRLGFSSVDCGDDKKGPATYLPGKRNQLFLNYHLYGGDANIWVPNLQRVIADPSILIRGYIVQDSWWGKASQAGVNFLATDNVTYRWPAFAPRAQAKPQTTLFVSQNSGLALSISGSSKSEGAVTDQSDWVWGGNQQWRLESVAEGLVKIVNVNSGLVLDVDHASTMNGAKVHQWSWHDGANQKWRLESAGDLDMYRIVSLSSGKVLDVSDRSRNTGAVVSQWVWLNAPNQKWRKLDV